MSPWFGSPQLQLRSGLIENVAVLFAGAGGSSSWRQNIRLQKDQPEEFMEEYCYRVVIEGIISAFKKVFGSMLASKKRRHQDVEVLCRFILWNCMR
jgi:transposase